LQCKRIGEREARIYARNSSSEKNDSSERVEEYHGDSSQNFRTIGEKVRSTEESSMTLGLWPGHSVRQD
jgi:hypothetical protein